MKQRMSQQPDPAQSPGRVTITYDITDCTLPITVVVDGRPCGSKTPYFITSVENASFDVEIPEGCEGGLAIDETGQSLDFAISIA